MNQKITEKQEIIVGVDIGGTNTVLGIVDLENRIIYENSFKTQSQNGVEDFFYRLSNIINNEYSRLEENYAISAIGIAAPSANYRTGMIESPANLKWGNVNLIEKMKKYFELPIAVINDANAAAIGEHTFGIARNMKNFIVLTLGTGLGSGIFIEGNLLQGENGLAGEFGHTIIDPEGRQCTCGRKGCLETYVSAIGIKRSVFNFLCNSDDKSELRNISYNELTGKKISELARNNDPIAMKSFNYTGEIFGKALANVVSYFNPEAIILFGGLADSDGLLMEPTNFYFDKHLLNVYKGKVKILKSELQNGKAAVLGACSFVREIIAKNSIVV